MYYDAHIQLLVCMEERPSLLCSQIWILVSHDPILSLENSQWNVLTTQSLPTCLLVTFTLKKPDENGFLKVTTIRERQYTSVIGAEDKILGIIRAK